jgi:NAD(P)-dependent dehydrogenase (short-subunit alcohol dehydrogenase family)
VHGTARTPEGAAALAKATKDTITGHVADMHDVGSVRALKDKLAGTPIDLLICNAGIYQPRDTTFGKTDYAAFADVMQVNVLAPLATVEALADNVAASARRIVVMISSRAGSMPETDGREYIYSASKAALNSLTRSCAGILGPRGVTCVTISPGWVRTDMGGKNAHLDPATSISALRTLFDRLVPADNGTFLDYTGEKIPW